MNRSSKAAFACLAALSGITLVLTSSPIAQGPTPMPSVWLQSGSPGTTQIGNSNISGTAIAGTFSGSGAGLIGIPWSAIVGAPTAFPPNGAAGGDLTGTYPNPTIAAGAVTSAKILDLTIAAADIGALQVGNAKISDVAWSKITGVPSGLPPGGAAGGDLSGTYPNPTLATLATSLNKVSGGAMTALGTGEVGIGTTTPTRRLNVTGGSILANWSHPNDTEATIEVRNNYNLTLGAGTWGISSSVLSDTVETKTAIRAAAAGLAGDKNGVTANATGAGSENRGVFASASGATTNIGVWGQAFGGSTNWGGYFSGDGYFSGNVGIGTAAPVETLTVAGDIRVGSGSDVNTTIGSGAFSILNLAGTAGLHLDTNEIQSIGGDLFINYNSLTGTRINESLFVLSNGKVGIGTSTPSIRLDIVDTLRGVRADAASDGASSKVGVEGRASGVGGNKVGVYGYAAGGPGNIVIKYGVRGEAFGDDLTDTAPHYGVSGVAVPPSGHVGSHIGVHGLASGDAGTSYGVYGVSNATGGTEWAGYFSGALYATSANASIKAFLIDHPLDPANLYLSHSCVESNEYKNMYDGTIKTDGKGYATVTVPTWFTALNKNFRYQLTIIEDDDSRDFVMAKVARKLNGGRFVIRTNLPNVEVSWQITGVRQDAMAKSHPLQVERDKPWYERGKYLNPVEHGQPEEKAMDYEGRTSR